MFYAMYVSEVKNYENCLGIKHSNERSLNILTRGLRTHHGYNSVKIAFKVSIHRCNISAQK